MSDVPEQQFYRGREVHVGGVDGHMIYMSAIDPWPVTCPACGGDGLPPSAMRYWLEPDTKCSTCDGKGTVIQ